MFRCFHSFDNIIQEIILIHDIVHVGSKVSNTLVLYWFVLYLFLVSSLQFLENERIQQRIPQSSILSVLIMVLDVVFVVVLVILFMILFT
jgi:hypothetical protein